ncbi:glycogen debranching enzyme [Anaeramoeba ignava]|uniref:Glycogen debranching enzyme n=1 Tax=Anaeramoeba ignava TaxID=1746090 RepID=A0A9Q0RFA0_ANAIG|nr:glycogen debranching enzyme [Anaeramoeba ignava]
MKHVWTVTLDEFGKPPVDGVVYVPRNSFFRVVVPFGSSVHLGSKTCLITDYPTKKTKSNEKKTFHKVKRIKSLSALEDWFAEIHVEVPGNFRYFIGTKNDLIELNRKKSNKIINSPQISLKNSKFKKENYEIEDEDPIKKRMGLFIVEPRLTINNIQIPTESIVLQTNLSKCLGKIQDWDEVFLAAKLGGYNMIHFTPVQKLGESGSNYSIDNQLLLNPNFFDDKNLSVEEQYLILEKKINDLEKNFEMLSLVDVVWNHTSNTSEWLSEHPEAGYTAENSPHLIPAFELDQALYDLTISISKNEIPFISNKLENEKDLESILNYIKNNLLPSIHLWEYFVIPVEQELNDFKSFLTNEFPYLTTKIQKLSQLPFQEKVKILRTKGITSPSHLKRNGLRVKIQCALSLFAPNRVLDLNNQNDKNLLDQILAEYKSVLNSINLPLFHKYDDVVASICHNLKHEIDYHWLHNENKKGKDIKKYRPITKRYFSIIETKDGKKVWVANNGWVMNIDPKINFASPKSEAYLRRQVVIWSDSIKLNYGSRPSSNPWLWDHMTKYTIKMAKIFHGFRIDNCHSTPIHVAQYLLHFARKVRPELFVVAELFTNSFESDILYISKMGISVMIRESYNSGSVEDFVNRIKSNGGEKVGCLSRQKSFIEEEDKDGKKISSIITELERMPPKTLFMDCTHDNQFPRYNRLISDRISNAALTSFAFSAIGSTRCFDELVPENPHVVLEKRLYCKINEKKPPGFIEIRKILSSLHVKMGINNYHQIDVKQNGNLIVVHRLNPHKHKGLLCVCFPSFKNGAQKQTDTIIEVPGFVKKGILYANLHIDEKELSNFEKDKNIIKGIQKKIDFKSNFNFEELANIFTLKLEKKINEDINQEIITQNLTIKEFTSGDVLILKVHFGNQTKKIIDNLNQLRFGENSIQEILSTTNLLDLNLILYRTKEEEKSHNNGNSYIVPSYGEMPFCGLEGTISVLDSARKSRSLNHPLIRNIINGDWLLDYILNRLYQSRNIIPFRNWLEDKFTMVKTLPRFLVPRYFDRVVNHAYQNAKKRCLVLMQSTLISPSNISFANELAMVSVQLFGEVRDAPLLSHFYYPPKDSLDPEKNTFNFVPSLSAGLPHFATGFVRCWGRDTFISLRGLFLVTKRFNEARNLLIAFGSSVRHGLIPNLLDSGKTPRYNSRDSVWWFLQAIQDYCLMSPEGNEFLNREIPRLYPFDSQTEHEKYMKELKKEGYRTWKISDMIQHIMTSHANGIDFVEWNAGNSLDPVMNQKGFQIQINFDSTTGFIFGGNQYNCGTWMDKNGSSKKSGNFGKPATPRDGAAIEIIGLLRSTIRWLSQIFSDSNQKKYFPHEGVEISKRKSNKMFLSYSQWSDLLDQSFESSFFIPELSENDSMFVIDQQLIQKRGIYKDTIGSSLDYADYQFRPNMLIAMVVAPELFERKHAQNALFAIQNELLGPFGMRTLSPKDPRYRPNYNNSLDSEDKSIAGGYNYHNGPEWLWLTGYFLRAVLQFNKFDDQIRDTFKTGPHLYNDNFFLNPTILKVLHNLWVELISPKFFGLPELTNKDGSYCNDSCKSQAWSAATLLDFLYDLKHLSYQSDSLDFDFDFDIEFDFEKKK